jgi:hypothetical protein
MKPWRVLSVVGLLALAQAACAPGPEGDSGDAATVPVRLARASSAGGTCEPTVASVRAKAARAGVVVWQLEDGCALPPGQTAEVSLVDWTFTGRDGRTVKGKHPFGPDCNLSASIQAGGSTSVACRVPVDADPGEYQYWIGLRVGETLLMRDPVIDIPW